MPWILQTSIWMFCVWSSRERVCSIVSDNVLAGGVFSSFARLRCYRRERGKCMGDAGRKIDKNTHILLGGKDAVHDGDVLRAGVLCDTEDDDSGLGLLHGRRLSCGDACC